MSITPVAKRHPVGPALAAFRPGVPEYYLAALADFESCCRPFAGLRILEIGGSSLPGALVLDALGCAQWVCVDMLGHVNGSYQVSSHAEHYAEIGIRRLQDCRSIDERPYLIFDGSADALPEAFHGHFDAVFSVNAFEHILDLDSVLVQITRVLKPGGRLFAQFGPVWSGYTGSHFWVSPEFNFSKHAPMAHWSHLLKTRDELDADMAAEGLSEAIRLRLVQQVFDSRGINRRHLEDYARALTRTELAEGTVERVWWVDPPPDLQARLESACPGYFDFSTTVARLLATRSPTGAACA